MDESSYENRPDSASGEGHLRSERPRNGANVLQLFDRPIAFHRCFVTLTGSVTAALLLSQAFYWQRRCKDPDGWWYKTRDHWFEETGMARREQEGARRKLRKLRLLQEERRGVPAQLWYRLDEARLLEALEALKNGQADDPLAVGAKPPFQLVQNRPTGRAKSAQQVGTKAPSKLVQNAPASKEDPETTTEIKAETTTTTPDPSCTDSPPIAQSESGGCGGFDLIFDFSLATLTPEQRERAFKTLEGLSSEMAQQVLDEWNHAHACGSIKQSKWGWLRKVAETARSGQFIPSAELADRRQAQAQAPMSEAREQPAQRKASPVWRQQREQLRNQLPDTDYGVYIAPLRGREDMEGLWLEAPNRTVAEWVSGNLPLIEETLRPHTDLPIRVCIG